MSSNWNGVPDPKRYAAYRMAAHHSFDKLWDDPSHGKKVSRVVRGRAYTWLAGAMGMPRHACHISEFNPVQCLTVIRLSIDRWVGYGPFHYHEHYDKTNPDYRG